MLELTVRLIASLAVVVGLMLLLARLVGKRYGARAGAPVQVLHRQQLSRSASVAVITVGSRVLVVGSTDHQVSLLTELDPEELTELADAELDGGVDLDLTQAVPVDPAGPAVDTTVAPTRARLASLASLSSLSALASLAQRGAPRGAQRGTQRAAAQGDDVAAIVQPVLPVEVAPSVTPVPRPAAATRAPSTDAGALAGSVLSAQTWRQAFAAATGKAS